MAKLTKKQQEDLDSLKQRLVVAEQTAAKWHDLVRAVVDEAKEDLDFFRRVSRNLL